MSHSEILRDERTVATENASYRWAYLFLAFGLLVSVAWRAFERDEAAWDLLALVVVSGVVTSVYQGARGVLTRRWVWIQLAAIIAGIVIAAFCVKALVVVFARRRVGNMVARVATDLRLRFLRALLAARWSYYTRQPSGLCSRALQSFST